jgi:hypothetical protein
VLDEKQSVEPSSASIPAARERPNERRDIQRTINVWQRNVSEDNAPPLLSTFDFSSMQGNWGHRFLICSDQHVENAAFVMYGKNFAQLLNLPEKVTAIVPLLQQIPERYRPVFADGCSKAMSEPVPARFSGAFSPDFTAELYRAVFLPIRLHPNWSKWLIFGSFNYRTVLSVDQKGL